jgi:hypothetical protein
LRGFAENVILLTADSLIRRCLPTKIMRIAFAALKCRNAYVEATYFDRLWMQGDT